MTALPEADPRIFPDHPFGALCLPNRYPLTANTFSLFP